MSTHLITEVKCDGFGCNDRLQFYTDNAYAAMTAAVAQKQWWIRGEETFCPVHVPVHGAPDFDAPYDDGLRDIPNLGLIGRNKKEELPPR